KLNYLYVDSGAMYRAVTLAIIRAGIPVGDVEKVVDALADIHIDFQLEPGKTRILPNGEDVSEEIRQMYVSDVVSEVSALKPIRLAMVAQQQRLGQNRHIVLDGRDIGTTEFPDADSK